MGNQESSCSVSGLESLLDLAASNKFELWPILESEKYSKDMATFNCRVPRIQNTRGDALGWAVQGHFRRLPEGAPLLGPDTTKAYILTWVWVYRGKALQVFGGNQASICAYIYIYTYIYIYIYQVLIMTLCSLDSTRGHFWCAKDGQAHKGFSRRYRPKFYIGEGPTRDARIPDPSKPISPVAQWLPPPFFNILFEEGFRFKFNQRNKSGFFPWNQNPSLRIQTPLDVPRGPKLLQNGPEAHHFLPVA